MPSRLYKRPPLVEGLRLFADPDQRAYIADGDNVETLVNLANRDLNFTASGSLRPTLTTAGGYRALDFSGSQYMTAGTNSDWNFLHQLSGMSVYVVVVPSNPVAFEGILATRAGGNEAGFVVNEGSNNRFGWTAGTGTTNLYANTTQESTLSVGNAFILSIVVGDGGSEFDRVCSVNGFVYFQSDETGTPATNSNDPLTLGAYGGGTSPFTGKILLALVYDVRHNAVQRKLMHRWLRRKYGNLFDTSAYVATVAGQSDAVGQGEISNSSFSVNDVIPNSFIYDRNDFTINGIDTFYPLTVGVNQNFNSNVATEMGYELTMCRDIAAQFGNCYLVKNAEGSTSLSGDWAQDGTGGNWNGFQTRVNEAKEQIEQAGMTLQPLANTWLQGQTESLTANTSLANAYEADQAEINASMRDLWGHSGMLQILGQFNVTASGYNNLETVQNAKVAVANADEKCFVVDAGSVLQADGIHRTAGSQELLGSAKAEKIIEELRN